MIERYCSAFRWVILVAMVRPRRFQRLFLLTGGAVLCAAVGLFFLREGRSQSDEWASVFGIFLNIVAIGLTIDSALSVRRGLTSAQRRPDPEYLENLATASQSLYRAEFAARRLQDPDPLPIEWAAADAELMDHPRNIWVADEIPDLTGTGSLLDAYLKVPTRRLVVLGEPGSGKSVAALMLAGDLLTARTAGEPVPVILPVSTWDPNSHDFRKWVRDRLAELDPRLSEVDRDEVPWAQRLVEQRLVLPILDGLDELPEMVKSRVLYELNAVLDMGEPIVITCRTFQYRAALRGGDVLTGAAVIRLRPLGNETVGAYLPRTTRPVAGSGTGKWDQVLRHMRDDPTGTRAEVLSTPLMVWLARVQYSDTSADPSRLLAPEFDDSDALRQHLLDGFILAAYTDSGTPTRSAAQAERWMIQLADLMRYRTNLCWWELANHWPLHWVRLAMVAAAATLSGAAVGVILGVRGGIGQGILLGVLFGLIVAVAVWLVPWLWRHPQPASLGATRGLRLSGRIVVIGLIPIGGAALINVSDLDVGMEWSALVALLATALIPLMAVPVETEQAVNPQRLLRADRISATAQGCLIGFGAGLLATTAAWTTFSTGIALLIGGIFAAAGGFAWALLGSSWGRFTLMRLYWRGRRLLPLRLMRMLAEAHRRGVLRQVGAAYQFRHELLRARLSMRGEPS